MPEPEIHLPDQDERTTRSAQKPTVPVAGSGQRAVRDRHLRLIAITGALTAAALGIGGAVASGALRGRTLSPPTHRVEPTSATSPALPAGPSWAETVHLTTGKGVNVTLELRAVVIKPGTRSADPLNPANQILNLPRLGGYYTLKNTSRSAFDLGEPVRFFAYWTVPTGLCQRYDPSMVADWTANNIPIIQMPGRRELCPLAFGDSTLDTTPLTLRPGVPATTTILSTHFSVGQDGPFRVSRADAANVARITATPPIGWLALDEELSPSRKHVLASRGLPLR